ncbi:MAG: hypothetical protein SFV53_07065, partial [Rickettsiales bacterium]|nr:hypothetical protein [Rickettsiales bacterium]
KSFLEDFKKNDFVLVVSGSGRDGSIKINQDAEIFCGKFAAQKTFNFVIKPKHKVWLQLIKGEIFLNEYSLENGDAAAIENESEITINAKKDAEFLLFDL